MPQKKKSKATSLIDQGIRHITLNNNTQAKALFEQALALGEASAAYNLALMSVDGRAGKINLCLANAYIARAEDLGMLTAKSDFYSTVCEQDSDNKRCIQILNFLWEDLKSNFEMPETVVGYLRDCCQALILEKLLERIDQPNQLRYLIPTLEGKHVFHRILCKEKGLMSRFFSQEDYLARVEKHCKDIARQAITESPVLMTGSDEKADHEGSLRLRSTA